VHQQIVWELSFFFPWKQINILKGQTYVTVLVYTVQWKLYTLVLNPSSFDKGWERQRDSKNTLTSVDGEKIRLQHKETKWDRSLFPSVVIPVKEAQTQGERPMGTVIPRDPNQLTLTRLLFHGGKRPDTPSRPSLTSQLQEHDTSGCRKHVHNTSGTAMLLLSDVCKYIWDQGKSHWSQLILHQNSSNAGKRQSMGTLKV